MFANPRIAFFGNSDISRIVLERLAARGIMPDLVVTTPDKPVGRTQTLVPTPTKAWAEENGVEYAEVAKLSDPAFLEKIKDHGLFIVASYGKIIPKSLIDMPKYGVLNIHPSLLPKYRGASPLQAEILADEKDVGVTIMRIDEEMDHGPIVAEKKIDIPDWPVGFRRLAEILGAAGAEMLADILQDYIKGNVRLQEQDHAAATFTKKTGKTDGRLDLADDPRKNYLKILAYEEWPGTYFEIERNGKNIRVIVKKAELQNGELKILRVLPEGKKEMDYDAFLRGSR
ncbi:MAG: methionyl-tRNA formyltransferase [Patescibacteria group bacterium]|nr:methionyl-tRNA formyltransferase [Patescibacteria group bacterium]MDE1945977.1 methionyl-tRNA formyltransferase [Patescibacteria group bacterium]